MKNLKRVLCFVLVCVLTGSLLPMTAAAEDIKVTAMEFAVQNVKVGEKGTAVKATVAGDSPIILENMATLRYDDAGEPGLLVKSNLLERGEIYWLCVNPVVKAGYSLTPFILQSLDSWTINGLPKGVSFDKIVVSGNQVRFRLTPLVEEIGSVDFTGLRAPQLGQTVQECYVALDEDLFGGSLKINGYSFAEGFRFGNILWDSGWLCDGTKTKITDVSGQITEGTYYVAQILIPDTGFTFANDVTVTFADAADVETLFDGEYMLVYAKFEVAAPCTVTYDYESQEDVVKQFNKGMSLADVAVTFAPPAETKAGYVFDKWILSEDTPIDRLEEPEDPSRTKIIGDVRFVPHWLKYYDEIHFEFSGYELGVNISDGVLTDNIDGYAPQKMPDLLGGNNFAIVADKGGKPDMTDPNTKFKIVTGKFEANTDYWLMIMIGGEGRDITGDIKLDATGIDDCFLDSPEYTDKWWIAEGEGELAFFKLKPLEKPAPATYTVTFDSDGGSTVAAQTVEEGKAATKPADPTKDGYTFQGWYLGSTAYDFSKPVTGDITLKAQWEKAVVSTAPYTITFDPNGGSVTPASMQTDTGGWLTGSPIPTHPDPNKLFDGWHTHKINDTPVAEECKFSEDTTLYAHWKDKPAHTIAEVYIESIQTPTPGVMPSNHVTIATTGVHGITDPGDTFWVRYDAASDSMTDVYEDSSYVDSVPFRAGETYLLMLVMEAQPNYGFTPDVKVFYKGAELSAPSMSDVTASAILDHDDEYIVVIINPSKAAPATYTVTFDSDGGSAVAAQTVENGKAAAKPADPTREGYTFKGWYLDSTAYDFSKPVSGDITLKAKWEPVHTHTYTDGLDGTCNGCDAHREEVETRIVVHMFRMYNPNTGEHFYTGSEVERDNLIGHGWQYEGVGFTFPANTGLPVHRLFQPSTGEHLYTMDEAEKNKLMGEGWNYEGIAFNSAYDTEAVQHRLHNPNTTVGAYHFTFSLEEKQNLIDAGWEYQGIGWYSCWK